MDIERLKKAKNETKQKIELLTKLTTKFESIIQKNIIKDINNIPDEILDDTLCELIKRTDDETLLLRFTIDYIIIDGIQLNYTFKLQNKQIYTRDCVESFNPNIPLIGGYSQILTNYNISDTLRFNSYNFSYRNDSFFENEVASKLEERLKDFGVSIIDIKSENFYSSNVINVKIKSPV